VLRDGRSVATGELKTVSDQQLIAHMVGREVENLFPRRAADTEVGRDTVLEVADLSSSRVLKHASFELRRGEIFGIAGLMGSGRTRLARTMFGLDPATGGSIKIKGKSFNAREGNPALRLRQKMGYVSEDRKGEGLAVTLSVADNLTITRFNSCATAGWLSLTRQAAQAESLINSLSVKARDVRQPVSMLSGGNQQKVAIGRLLHQDADILLLNEPTRGVDIGSKAQIYKIIADCAQQGKAVLIISSYLPELFGMCDRLAVMSRGRLSPARSVHEWTPESVMQAAIGGEGN